MFEIKIYGEIIPFQDQFYIENGYVNLTSVQKQLQEAAGSDVKVRINSVGGDVEEGFAIYSELRRYARDHKAKITTFAEGRCASIATIIFLAGDERITTEYTSPFVHNAWTYAEGDAKELLRTVADLEKCNEMIAKHYATHTNLTYEDARELMDSESYITPEECVNLRFATSVEEVLRPVALSKIISKSNKSNHKMTKESKKVEARKDRKGILNRIKQFFDKEVFTADNEIIDFYEKEDDDTVSVGDKATVDGAPAEGEYVMANGDKYIFDSGELVEIIEMEDGAENSKNSEDSEQEEVEELEKKVEELESVKQELEEEVKELEEENEELADALERAEARLKNLRNLNKKFKDIDGKRENKTSGKPSISAEVEKFKQNKLKR